MRRSIVTGVVTLLLASTAVYAAPNPLIQLHQALQFATNGTHLLIIWQSQQIPAIIWKSQQVHPQFPPVLDYYSNVNGILMAIPSDIILTPELASTVGAILNESQMAKGLLVAFPGSLWRDATLVQVELSITLATGILTSG